MHKGRFATHIVKRHEFVLHHLAHHPTIVVVDICIYSRSEFLIVVEAQALSFPFLYLFAAESLHGWNRLHDTWSGVRDGCSRWACSLLLMAQLIILHPSQTNNILQYFRFKHSHSFYNFQLQSPNKCTYESFLGLCTNTVAQPLKLLMIFLEDPICLIFY